MTQPGQGGTWLVAEGGRVWSADAPPADARIVSADPDRAEVEATALVSRLCDGIADETWQLELSGLAAMALRPEILQAVTLAEAAAVGGPVALDLPPGLRADTVRGVAAGLLGQGAGLACLRETVLQLAAGLLGWAILLLLVARHGGGAQAALAGGGDVLLAVHAEDATRTRHLVRMASEAGAAPVLLLGRPQAGQAGARAALDPGGRLPQGTRLVRPLSLTACLAGLLPGLRLVLRGAGPLAGTGLSPALRDRLAMGYRVMQGAAHAAWWRRVRPGARGVIFGHTGTADTSLLERAMQRHGLCTLHAVHGTGLGWSFAGISDVALFHSGADADAAARLPGYGRCTHLAMPCPPLAQGEGPGKGRWLLLTSYTHPLNPDYAARGAAADIAVVHWLAEAAAALGQAPDRVTWRPHPMLAQVAPAARAALKQAVEAAGFSPWPADLPYEALAGFDQVVTTPSTTLTDALRLGAVPVLAVAAPLQRDLVYAAHPLIARSGPDLSAMIRSLSDIEARRARQGEAWAAIRPGAPMTMAAAQEALRGACDRR